MKYRLKIDKRYILAYFVEMIALIAILSSFEMFSIGDATRVVIAIGALLSILFIGLYYGTYIILDKESMTIYYFGFIKKTIPLKELKIVSTNYSGRGTLALSTNKMLLRVAEKEVAVSICDSDQFILSVNLLKSKE